MTRTATKKRREQTPAARLMPTLAKYRRWFKCKDDNATLLHLLADVETLRMESGISLEAVHACRKIVAICQGENDAHNGHPPQHTP